MNYSYRKENTVATLARTRLHMCAWPISKITPETPQRDRWPSRGTSVAASSIFTTDAGIDRKALTPRLVRRHFFDAQ